MQVISHRINSISELKNTSTNLGVEIDIRTHQNNLILAHDPFKNGEKFLDWIEFYQHKTLILNVKEEGLENHIIPILKKYSINDYFFLDQSFPFLIKTSLSGEKKCAVRFSEFESIKTALNLTDMVEWIWIDFFSKFPMDYSTFLEIKKRGFKICGVSPELQGKKFKEVEELYSYLNKKNIILDAICTKIPEYWS